MSLIELAEFWLKYQIVGEIICAVIGVIAFIWVLIDTIGRRK